MNLADRIALLFCFGCCLLFLGKEFGQVGFLVGIGVLLVVCVLDSLGLGERFESDAS